MSEKKVTPIKRILRYFLLIILILVLFIGVAYFFSMRKSKSYTAPIPPVSVIYPAKHVLKDSFFLSAYVEGESMVPVVPFVDGTIIKYNIEAGDYVKKDEVIAEIDPEPYRYQALQAEAQYKVYEASFKRVETLYKEGAASKQNYDELLAQRDAALAQYNLANVQLGYASVKAPIDGTVLMAPSSVGSIGTSSQPLAIITDLDNLIVNVSVPEKYFTRINSNIDAITYNIIREADNERAESTAQLVSLSPYIDPQTKTFTLKLKLDDPALFRPGMFIKVEIIYREDEVLSLPQKARKLDGSVYFIDQDKDGSVVARYTTFPKDLEDDDYFAIPDEWENKEFIIKGQNNVLSGQSVNIVEEVK